MIVYVGLALVFSSFLVHAEYLDVPPSLTPKAVYHKGLRSWMNLVAATTCFSMPAILSAHVLCKIALASLIFLRKHVWLL